MRNEVPNQFWKDTTVDDATFNAVVVLRKEDIEAGVPGDPANCAFTLACRRQFGTDSAGIMFWRDICYIDFGDGSVQRFRLPARTRKQVEAFDEDPALMEPGVYEVRAPTRSQTLLAKRKRDRERKGRPARNVAPPRARFVVRGSEAYLKEMGVAV